MRKRNLCLLKDGEQCQKCRKQTKVLTVADKANPGTSYNVVRLFSVRFRTVRLSRATNVTKGKDIRLLKDRFNSSKLVNLDIQPGSIDDMKFRCRCSASSDVERLDKSGTV